jgi:hypothetical protein
LQILPPTRGADADFSRIFANAALRHAPPAWVSDADALRLRTTDRCAAPIDVARSSRSDASGGAWHDLSPSVDVALVFDFFQIRGLATRRHRHHCLNAQPDTRVSTTDESTIANVQALFDAAIRQ